jgi:hypothetical protein
VTWDTLCWARGAREGVDNLRWDLRLGRTMMLMTQPPAGLCRITEALDGGGAASRAHDGVRLIDP